VYNVSVKIVKTTVTNMSSLLQDTENSMCKNCSWDNCRRNTASWNNADHRYLSAFAVFSFSLIIRRQSAYLYFLV